MRCLSLKLTAAFPDASSRRHRRRKEVSPGLQHPLLAHLFLDLAVFKDTESQALIFGQCEVGSDGKERNVG